MAASRDLPAEAADLFRGPPEEFIAARDALVRRLREQGRDDDSATVKALRKPTVVAWALDQLAERDPAGIEELFDTGAEVRAAQQSALTSTRGATERLRTATSARRVSIGRLSATAVAALTDAGRYAGAHGDALVAALETCSVDDEAGSRLRSGTLERPPATTSGFGDVFGLAPVAGPAADPGGADNAPEAGATQGKPRRGSRARSSTEAGRDDAEVAAQVARLRRDRDAAARRAAKARSAADAFAHELEGMRRRLAVVERKHASAAGAAAERETELVRAERALRAAGGGQPDDA